MAAAPDQAVKPTARKLVEAAADLFWRNGYEATGLAEIYQAAGVNSGSFYYFFKTKENLLLAVLDHHLDVMHARIFGPIRRASLSPVGKVFAVLGFYRDFLKNTGFEMGCPIGSLALELGSPSAQVRGRLSRIFDAWCAEIRGFLVEASAELPPGTDLDSLARFVLTVMEGGVMQARTARSLQPFDDSVEALQSHFALLKQRL